MLARASDSLPASADCATPSRTCSSARSSGNPASVNSETGAYGIGQLSPENASNPRSPRPGSTASKYPGYDGSASEQINAMASYIENTYGTPTAALAAEHTTGWY